jgi:competence protein ComEA
MSLLSLLMLSLALNSAQAITPSKKVNINTASVKELMHLPGIGKSKAKEIVSYRQAKPFRTISDIMQIKGIGKKLYAKIQAHITVMANSSKRSTSSFFGASSSK